MTLRGSANRPPITGALFCSHTSFSSPFVCSFFCFPPSLILSLFPSIPPLPSLSLFPLCCISLSLSQALFPSLPLSLPLPPFLSLSVSVITSQFINCSATIASLLMLSTVQQNQRHVVRSQLLWVPLMGEAPWQEGMKENAITKPWLTPQMLSEACTSSSAIVRCFG